MERLKMAVIGAGDVAGAHVASLSENRKVEVAAIADPDQQSADTMAQRYGVGKVVNDYHDILTDPSITVVDICTPHYLHYMMTMDSLNAGKNVICEKPMAMTVDEADRMIEAAHELGLWLLIVLNQRFMPMHRKIRELVNDDKLGDPFLANAFITGDVLARLNDPYDWKSTWDRAGGGTFFDTGTHIVDLMQYWFGRPSAVTAVLRKLLTKPENKADDNASVTLEYGDDLIAGLVVSYTVANEGWSEKKFIYGTGGDVSMINEAVVPMFYVRDSQPEIIEVEHSADWWAWSIDRCLRHFVDCIAEGADPEVTAEDARDALKTIAAAYQSDREGRKIRIDWQ